MTEEHKRRVLEHQQIIHLFACGLEELFEIYQGSDSESDPDSTLLAMIYAIGRFRFGDSAWSNQHSEYFKQRARQNAAAGISNLGSGGRKPPKPISLEDLDL